MNKEDLTTTADGTTVIIGLLRSNLNVKYALARVSRGFGSNLRINTAQIVNRSSLINVILATTKSIVVFAVKLLLFGGIKGIKQISTIQLDT